MGGGAAEQRPSSEPNLQTKVQRGAGGMLSSLGCQQTSCCHFKSVACGPMTKHLQKLGIEPLMLLCLLTPTLRKD